MKLIIFFKLLIATSIINIVDATLLFTISDANIGQIISGFFSLVSLIVTLLIKGRIERVNVKVDAYHKEVDGMKTALVEAVKGKGEAEGNLKGRIEQTQELKDLVVSSEIKPENITITADKANVSAATVTVAKK